MYIWTLDKNWKKKEVVTTFMILHMYNMTVAMAIFCTGNEVYA